MQRIIGRIQIEDDLRGWARVRLKEQIDKQRLQLWRVVADPVVARRLGLAQLQPVQRRFARNRRTLLAPRPQLARKGGKQRVVSQLVMVIEVFIAQRQPKDPLTHQRGHQMLNQFRPATVHKAIRQPVHQPQRPVRVSQKQSTRIGGDRPTVKTGHNFMPSDASKLETLCAIIGKHRDLQNHRKCLSQNNFQ